MITQGETLGYDVGRRWRPHDQRTLKGCYIITQGKTLGYDAGKNHDQPGTIIEYLAGNAG